MSPPSTLAFRLAGCSLLLAVAACAQQRASQAAEATARAFAARGYEAAEAPAQALASTDENWQLGGHDVPLHLDRPARDGAWPVVLYLPGLGEDKAAGGRWRARWAAAGYAVVTVQPLQADVSAFRSELARSGEFRALARERYAAPEVAQRLQVLNELVAVGRQRSGATGAWHGLDWDRLAIAGFELGAYTAMAAAGEQVPGLPTDIARPRPRAVVAFSPHATLSGGALDSRFGEVRIPVLSVTSDTDGDPLGLVEAAALRDAPFMHMPGPDKLLLRLSQLSHKGLSGGDETPSGSKDTADGRHPAAPDGGGRDGGRGHGGRRSGGTDGGQAGRGPGTGTVEATARTASPAAERLRIIAAQDVSVAFLDAHLKEDALAQRWLSESAGRWLGSIGELRAK